MSVCTSCGASNPEGFRFCGACGAPLVAVAGEREQRKVVTIVFCDVTGSTALGERLDPESLRALLARYFERMRLIVERHGGTVEKFIGDAVMAVFGVPRLHEDDAVRALRAAVEMRTALPDLGVQGRIGVATGEVVAGTEERLATGNAVNVAARLQQGAAPGEVLVAYGTVELVRDTAVVEPVGPLGLRGKAEPVDAYRLLGVRDILERTHEMPFVGRTREVAVLRDAWKRVRADGRCELVTIVGDAGVGKSRLVAEFLGMIEARAARGRCLPYGEGITYWPVVEVLKQLDILPMEPAAVGAIRALLGETEAVTSADEIAWAFRKTLERAAVERSLVVVFDDIQWAEVTFLDLIEHVALLTTEASILLVCMARPELRGRRSDWPVTIELTGLADDDVDAVIPAGLPTDVRGRVARAAGGNPLFVEEMVAVASGGGEMVVPPSLRALIGARLDQLDPVERSVLEGAAVEGEVFHRGAVQVLASSDTVVTPRLAALVRRGLIRPDRAQLAGEDGFRFRHLLIRDAAYDAMPKALRAELHARFAVWLERRGADLVEIDDILGYHLEQACRYRSELGLVDEGGALAAAARTRLTAAGRRARMRHDFRAAFNLFQRATELIPGGSIELGLELDYIETLVDLGGTRQARECARGLTERAVCLNNRVAEVTAQIAEQSLLMNLDPEGAADRLGTLIEGALPTLEAAGDDLALCVAHRARGNVANMRARADGQLDGYRKAVEHAQRAGLPHLWSELLPEVGAAMLMGSTPVPDVLAWLDEQELHNPGHFGYRILRAASFAMLGRFNEARNIRDTVRRVLIDQGAALPLAATTGYIGVLIDLLAEDYHAAAEMAREACCVLEQSGERAFLSGAAGLLAAALYALDQLDEAETEADRAARMASSDDAASQMLSRQVRAKVHARRGAHAEAERLAREAVVIADETDHMNERGDAYSDLAEVLVIVGKTEKAVHTLETAATLFVQKGNVPAHERIRARLARLRASAPTSAG